MIIRNHLRSAVPGLCLLALSSFFLIFFIGVAFKHQSRRNIQDFVTIEQSRQDRWAEMPGLLKYTYQ